MCFNPLDLGNLYQINPSVEIWDSVYMDGVSIP